MPETGGMRKLRWGIDGRGKSGSVRLIYYFYNETVPIVLLTLFAKKTNLTKAERTALKQIAAELANYGGSQ